MPSKPHRPGQPKPSTALDEKQRALAEQEAKLREKMERCEKLIEDAPKLQKERQRQQRDELITRASRTETRAGSRTALPDRRFGYEANVAAPAQHRRMRAERRQGRLTFFALLIVLTVAVCVLYYTVTHS